MFLISMLRSAIWRSGKMLACARGSCQRVRKVHTGLDLDVVAGDELDNLFTFWDRHVGGF